MNEFFSMIFNWMSSLYDQDWDNFLYQQGYYSYLGIILLVVAVLAAAIFYYSGLMIFTGKKKWFIFMVVSALLIFAISFGVSDYWAGNATEEELPTIDGTNEFGTSFIGAIWGSATFFLTSLIMKLFSTDNKHVPF